MQIEYKQISLLFAFFFFQELMKSDEVVKWNASIFNYIVNIHTLSHEWEIVKVR